VARLAPEAWAAHALRLYRALHADALIAEVNKGCEGPGDEAGKMTTTTDDDDERPAWRPSIRRSEGGLHVSCSQLPAAPRAASPRGGGISRGYFQVISQKRGISSG
jgi:hypothetical protein